MLVTVASSLLSSCSQMFRLQTWAMSISRSQCQCQWFQDTFCNVNVNSNVSFGVIFNTNVNVNFFSSPLSMSISMSISQCILQCQYQCQCFTMFYVSNPFRTRKFTLIQQLFLSYSLCIGYLGLHCIKKWTDKQSFLWTVRHWHWP